MRDFFIHKEPVLNRRKAVYGQELCFRKPVPGPEQDKWVDVRINEDILGVITPVEGFERLAANRHSFLNIDVVGLESGIEHSLPRRSVLILPQKDIQDRAVQLKSPGLKKLGFQLAADYSLAVGGPLPSPQVFDMVRIDVTTGTVDEVAALVRSLKETSLKLLAANVRTTASFDEFHKLEFDLFQGAFYEDLQSGPTEPISHSQTALIALSRDLQQNRDIEIIERTFKGSPKLTFGLLTLMNSAYMGVRQKVTSIRQAIALLGYVALEKWVVMLLFTVEHGNDQTNPLVEKAVLRGMVMDRLAKKAGAKPSADSAFMAGMLSLFTLLFDVKAEELTGNMSLGEEIQAALSRREGILGTLLTVVERMDRQDYHLMAGVLHDLPVTVRDVLEAETQSVFDCQGFFYRD